MTATAFFIDKGVPIPPRRGRRTKDQWTIWPFDDMEAPRTILVDGTPELEYDSFFVGGIAKADAARRAALEYSAQYRGVTFTTRIFESDPITKLPGVRVWRVT